jgi:hypothetical protein
MPCPDQLSQWFQEVSAAFSHLSKPQVLGLVLWSAGIALSGAAGIAQISALLALVLHQEEQTVFQRLREWYLDAKHKSGKRRRELDVTSCFAPLLRWIVHLWGTGNRKMVLVGQPAIGLQTRIAAPEPAKRRRRARSRRRPRLPFPTKGVGCWFQPSTVCSNHSMIC